jgi:hypothetical protein
MRALRAVGAARGNALIWCRDGRSRFVEWTVAAAAHLSSLGDSRPSVSAPPG